MTPRLFRIACLASLLIAGAASVRAQSGGFTPLRRDVGIGTPSSQFDTLMPYHHTFPGEGYGRWIFQRTVEPGPLGPDGSQAPHGYIKVDSRAETAAGEYLYVNYNTEAKWQGKAGSNSDPMPSLRDIPFDIAFFSTSEPLPYGIETVSHHKEVTAGTTSGISHMTALVRDPDRAEFSDRNSRFGYRHHSVLTIPLRVNQNPADIIYRKRDNNTEGQASGVLPPGDYAVVVDGQYSVSDGGFGNTGTATGDHGIFSGLESWIIIGKVAAWKEAVDGSYGTAARWIAQQQPQPDFRVIFRRPNTFYKVSGITGTVRRYEFGGSLQTVTLDGGSANATDEILVSNDHVKLDGATLSSPKVTLELGAQLELLNTGRLHADPAASGSINVGIESGNPNLIVQVGSQARAGNIFVGLPGGGGCDDCAGPDPAGPTADVSTTAGAEVQTVGGTVHLGSGAYSSNAEVAVAQKLHVRRGARLVSATGVIERTATPDAFQLDGEWANSGTVSIGQTGTAEATVGSSGRLQTDILVLGETKGADGALAVTAANCDPRNLLLGHGGTGKLTLTGSVLKSDNISIAQQAGSHGELRLSGSSLETKGLVVGNGGNAFVDLTASSFVNAQSLDVADEAGSNGEVHVRGSGTALITTLADIGAGGPGLLDVSNGGVLQGDGARINIGKTGTVKVRGSGSSVAQCGFNVRRDGRLEFTSGAILAPGPNGISTSPGSHLLFDSSVGNSLIDLVIEGSDAVVRNGSTMEVEQLEVESTGALALAGADTLVTVSGGANINGQLSLSDGAIMQGANAGSELGLGGGARVTGNAGTLKFPVVDNPYGVFIPGSSPGSLTIDGDYTQGTGGVLELEIGGTNAGVDYDQLIVTGNATLNGVVVLRFVNGFVPAAGQQFDLIDVDGAFTGNPVVIVLGLEPGWQYSGGIDPSSGGFQIVSQNNGVAAPPLPGGATGDADADGLANLLEESIGTDPLANTTTGLPTLSIITDPADNKRYLIYTYDRALAATQSTFVVEVSTDLQTWDSGSAVTQPFGTPQLSPDGKKLGISTRILPALEDVPTQRRFVRLHVSK